MIKAGDIVRVTDWGLSFPTWREWFEERKNELDFMWVLRYAYDNSVNFRSCCFTDETRYIVLYIDSDCKRALITDDIYRNLGKVYLIGLDGIELYGKPTEMTISEIEEKLGIKNLKIVEEKKDD